MAKSSSGKSRPWTVDDLYNRKAHIRAVPILVLEKWEREGGTPGADCLTTDEINDELVVRGLLSERMTRQGAGNLVGSFRQTEKRLNLKPPLVEPVDRGVWRFNVRYYESLLRDFRERYPLMGEDARTPVSRSLANEVLQVLQEHEKAWQERLQDADNRARAQEQETRELREKLRESSSILNEITDDKLKERVEPLFRLDTLPLDTIVREAGVVLEDRLRAVAGTDSSLAGVRLVDAILSPEQGMLIFSHHRGEQDGVRMLYRGAMQFIRNPPMHKLIEYPEDTVRLFMRLIDVLLQLLSEGGRETLAADGERKRKQWSEEEFFSALSENVNLNVVGIVRDLYEWGEGAADRLCFGTGVATGSFGFHYLRQGKTYSVFTIYTNGTLMLNFGSLSDKMDHESLEQFHKKITGIPAFRRIRADFSKWPSISVVDAFKNSEEIDEFKEAVQWLEDRIV